MTTTEDAFPDLFADLQETQEFRNEFADAQTQLGLLKFLVHARQDLGMNQTAIAEGLGVRQSVISDLENGNTSPRLPVLMQYARAVNAQITVLVNGREVRSCLDSFTPVTHSIGTLTPITSHINYQWQGDPVGETGIDAGVWGGRKHG